MKEEHKVIFLTTASTALEWYSFILFANFHQIISELFLPSISKTNSIIELYFIFALGFIVRPFGAIIFGHIGDKYGRKPAMFYSIILMSVSTILIGLLPTYQSIGITATIILIFFRILQGIAIGGQSGGSIIYVKEHIKQNQSFFIGLIQSSIFWGMCLGSLAVYVVKHNMPHHEIISWGWRIAFIFSIILSLFGLIIHKLLTETPEFLDIKDKTLSLPIKHIINEPLALLKSIFLLIPVNMGFFVLTVFIQGFLIKNSNLPLKEVIINNGYSYLIIIMVASIAGYLSDKIGKKTIPLIGLVTLFISYLILKPALISANTTHILFVQKLLSFSLALYLGTIYTLVVNLFYTNIRYTGTSLAINLCASLFGCTIPIAGFLLINKYGMINGINTLITILIITTIISIYSLLKLKTTSFSDF